MPDPTAPALPEILPLPLDQEPGSASWWKTQTDWAADIRKDLLADRRHHAKGYAGELEGNQTDAIRVNIEFEKTEQKRHKLLYRLPALKLRATPRTIRDSQPPMDPATGQPQLDPTTGQPVPARNLRRSIAIFKEVVTREMGPKGANTKTTMDQLIFDNLCPAGIGFAKVGYEQAVDETIPITTGKQIPDPNFQQPPGAVLGLMPAPLIPETQDVPNVISETYYVARISPALALVPPEFRGGDYEQADWLGHDFSMRTSAAEALGWDVPTGKGASWDVDDDDRIMPLKKKGARQAQLRCREIFYYASRIDPTVKHPDKIRRLVFVSGVKDPVVHEDYKEQRFDARGRFVGGLRRLPIKVYTLRYVSDSAYPPSDCAITKRPVEELAEFRTIQMKHRRKASAQRWIDVHGIINDTIKRAVEKGEYYDTIPTDGPGDKFIGEIGQAHYPPDNVMSEDRIMADINRAWALGANSSSVQEKGSPTATEIASISQATANRMNGEADDTTQFWCRLAEAVGCLIQLHMTHEDYVEIVGEDGAKSVEAFTGDDIQGEFLYEAIPNSAQAPDAASDRDLALNRYNLLANDPFANREQLYRDTVEAYDGDPDRLTKQPIQPPPDKPKVNVGITGVDLDPSVPQYPNVQHLLSAAGIPMVAPVTVAQPPADPSQPPNVQTGPAKVVDRERMRMAAADNADQRAGGLVSVGVGGR